MSAGVKENKSKIDDHPSVLVYLLLSLSHVAAPYTNCAFHLVRRLGETRTFLANISESGWFKEVSTGKSSSGKWKNIYRNKTCQVHTSTETPKRVQPMFICSSRWYTCSLCTLLCLIHMCVKNYLF